MELALPVDDSIVFDGHVIGNLDDLKDMTAEQFLSWVRHEASEYPDVCRAEVNSSLYAGRQSRYMPEVEAIATCDSEMLPSPDWERDVISTFSELRALLSRLSQSESSRQRKQLVPQLKDELAWHKFCLGSESMEFTSSLSSSDIRNDFIKDETSGDNEMDMDVFMEQRKLELTRSLELDPISHDDNGSYLTLASADEPTINDAYFIDNIGGIPVAKSQHNHDNILASEDMDEVIDVEVEDEMDCPCPKENASKSTYIEWAGIQNATPTTSLLLQFDQVMTQRVLQYHAEWLEERYSTVYLCDLFTCINHLMI